EINKKLTTFLSHYDKLQNLSHFGQELTEDVKKDLLIGDNIYEFFKQPYQQIIPTTVQLVIISMILQGLIETKEMLEEVKKKLVDAFYDRGKQKELYKIADTNDIKVFNENVMKSKDTLLTIK
ncbi:MAG: hypothetical protein ABIO02_04265, partial [Patescibacteria group bacterium]